MEIRLSYGISLCLIQMAIFTSGAVYGNECRLCKPGYYASRLCSETHDTVCKPCSLGTFSPKPNVLRKCHPCSICDVGEFALKECSKSRNTVCMSCDLFKGKIRGTFVLDCLQNIYGQTAPNSRTIYDSINRNRHKRSYESSGTSDDNNNYVGDGGSGLTNEDGKAISVTVTEEGSGAMHEIDDITGRNVTTALNSTLLGDDNKEDDIGREIAITTGKTGKIEQGGEGIILQTKSSNGNNSEVISNTVVQLTTTASTNILITNKIGAEPDINGKNDRMSEGQHTQEKGTNMGVVVAVGLVVAVVFFVLGFIANKYWSSRRERTFNMEEAEQQNSMKQVAFYKIEYRGDHEKTPRSNYNMIPAKLNGSASEMRPASDIEIEDMSEPANSQQVHRITALVSNPALSPPVVEKANAGSQESRPESEIHFIDAGKNESDAFLSSQTSVGETIHETSPTSSRKSHSDTNNDVDTKDEHEMYNETTLMLTKNSEIHCS